MGYTTDFTVLRALDKRSKKLIDFIERNSSKPVDYYCSISKDALVATVEWFGDKNGKYCVINTNQGRVAYHRELSQVVDY